MRVDSHMHVWRAAQGDTPGVQTIVPPQADVSLELASQTMAEHGVDRAVLVQPVFRGDDNSYIAQCVRSAPGRFAGVCVVDPRNPQASSQLAHWKEQGIQGLRLRPRIGAEEAAFGDPSTFPLWQSAERSGMVVSLLCGPSHAGTIAALAERFLDTSIVIDHMGHPSESARDATDLLQLARYPRVFMKVSGFYHFSTQGFPFSDCWPFLRAVYDHFGPERLLWGSDFPHVAATTGYARSLLLPEQALTSWNSRDRELIMGGNALKLYWRQE
jgi:L-fuconolactonase